MKSLLKWVATAVSLSCLLATGCVESQSVQHSEPFETEELDSCLAIVVDMSSSFASRWEKEAYDLFVDLSDQYFTEAMGTNAKLVICQLSGSERVVLFEGKPADLQRQFSSPAELSAFLQERADGASSRVYDATRRTVDYLNAMPGISEKTRLLTVIFSDMRDSESDQAARTATGRKMVESLVEYREKGGALALYYVANSETSRWREIGNMAGFAPGRYLIENELTARPQLPRFD